MDPETLALIFGLFHAQGWSVSRIGRHVRARHNIVREVLAGDRQADDTVELRALYPPYEEADPSFTDDQLARVFAGYHDDGLTLSALGRELDTSYGTVRRILTGEHHGERTAGLLARYPAYTWFRGITSFTDDQLDNIFRSYQVDHESLDDLARRYEAQRNTIRDLISGRKGAAQTARFRAKYGSGIRPKGAGGRRARTTVQ